ncbi:MAG: hypothetical protein M1456_04425, partial [Actinobacteria bacterium]|nr:hypothetical protein [Actinomycetota bacterium]
MIKDIDYTQSESVGSSYKHNRESSKLRTLAGSHLRTGRHRTLRSIGMVLLAVATSAMALIVSAVSAGPAFAQSSSCSTSGAFCMAVTNGSISIAVGSLTIPFTGLSGSVDGTYYTGTNNAGDNVEFPTSEMNFNPITNPTLTILGNTTTATGTVALKPTQPAFAYFNPSSGAISNMSLTADILINLTKPLSISNCSIPQTISGFAGTESGGKGTITGKVTEQISSFVSIVKQACPSLASLLGAVGTSGTATATITLPFTMTPASPSAVAGSPASTSGSTTPTSTTPSTTTTPTASTPTTSTGKPWSGWTWWLLDALAALA